MEGGGARSLNKAVYFGLLYVSKTVVHLSSDSV
jgi:hypothetical protein